MLIKSQKDFYSGLMFTIVGAGFAIGATEYTVGQAARMGPGYFPLLLGIILALLGIIITVKSLSSGAPDGDKIGEWAWRPLIFVILANLAFGALLAGIPDLGLPHFGMVIAIFALVVIASFAGDSRPNMKEVVIVAAILAAGSYLVFIKMLNLQMPVWPAFLGG